jgi:hypothetical protein
MPPWSLTHAAELVACSGYCFRNGMLLAISPACIIWHSARNSKMKFFETGECSASWVGVIYSLVMFRDRFQRVPVKEMCLHRVLSDRFPFHLTI